MRARASRRNKTRNLWKRKVDHRIVNRSKQKRLQFSSKTPAITYTYTAGNVTPIGRLYRWYFAQGIGEKIKTIKNSSWFRALLSRIFAVVAVVETWERDQKPWANRKITNENPCRHDRKDFSTKLSALKLSTPVIFSAVLQKNKKAKRQKN